MGLATATSTPVRSSQIPAPNFYHLGYGEPIDVQEVTPEDLPASRLDGATHAGMVRADRPAAMLAVALRK